MLPLEKNIKKIVLTLSYFQTPKSWIKESCVGYSQVLTTKLSMEKFQDYVTNFLQKVVDQKLLVSFMVKLVTADSLTKTVIKQICSTGGLGATLQKATAG